MDLLEKEIDKHVDVEYKKPVIFELLVPPKPRRGRKLKDADEINARDFYAIIKDDEWQMHRSIKNIIDECRLSEDRLTQKWVNSKYTDFSVYEDPEYIEHMITCFEFSSKFAVRHILKFLSDKGLDYTKLKFFDDYNGFGFSTIKLMEAGIEDVSFYNNIPFQVGILEKLCNRLNFKMPNNDLAKEGLYDVYMCIEVAEHYFEPMPYIEKIAEMVKPGGYLVFSTNFTSMYPGHFPEYKYTNPDGTEIMVKNTLFRRYISRFLKKHFRKVHVGFNGKPLVYQKK